MAGRGGAGNILQAATTQATRDLEAGRDETANVAGTPTSDFKLHSERTEPVIALAGRGGAGNAYNLAELHKTGTYRIEGANTTHPPGPQPAPRMHGRGGAGNYGTPSRASGAVADDADASNDALTGEALRRQATEDVERGLARPDRAYLGPKSKDKDVSGLGI